MSVRVRGFVLLAALGGAAGGVEAQDAQRIHAGAIWEDYSFAEGYVLEGMSQLTNPISLDVSLGARASLLLSTGHAFVTLRSRDEVQVAGQSLRGPLDTDLRVSFDVSEQVLVFAAGTLPTGRQTVVEDNLSLLSALSNDAIGFTAPSLGSGGRVALGAATALAAGSMAIGLAATGAYSFDYTPVSSEPVRLSPGPEVRIRAGLEGPLAARTYLRLSGSVIGRQKDRLDGVAGHGLGHRAVGYVSLQQGMGPVLFSVHAFDVFRSSPQLEPTAFGAATLPRGNLVAGGVTLSVPVGSASSVAAMGEYRVSTAAPGVEESELVRQASVLRLSGEIRHRIGSAATLVLRGGGATGEVRQSTTFFAVTGYRVGLSLEVSP